jgi:ribosomal protein S27E
MKVECEVHNITLDNEDGYEIDSVAVRCSRCGNEAEAYGDSDRSVRRCFVELRGSCPRREHNLYYTSEE